MAITIREIQAGDAEAFLELCKQLDRETAFMMLEPDERITTLAEQRGRIEAILSQENQILLLAEHDGKLVGYIAGLGETYRRNRHSAYIVIGILQAFSGQGIGKRLFAELETWARQHQIHRMELTVMAHNERAVGLYKHMGFEIEGTKRDSLRVDGAYVDEYYMGKLL